MLHFYCCLYRSFIYYENIMTGINTSQTEKCDDKEN